MDKILLTAFLSSLAGFITSVLSIVKLVNEKESKTTDYRQNWTDSARTELASLIGLLNAQASHITSTNKVAQRLYDLHKEDFPKGQEELKENATEHFKHSLKENQALVRETRQQIYQSYARARLHFKPDDISFSRVEQHFNLIIGLLQDLQNSEKPEEMASLREKVHAAANEMTGFCRHILKTEWETVKKGERAYQLTKKWSIAGSIAMLFILLSIGIHAGLSMWRADLTSERSKLFGQSTNPANSQKKVDESQVSLTESSATRPTSNSASISQISSLTICPTIAPQAAAKANIVSNKPQKTSPTTCSQSSPLN